MSPKLRKVIMKVVTAENWMSIIFETTISDDVIRKLNGRLAHTYASVHISFKRFFMWASRAPKQAHRVIKSFDFCCAGQSDRQVTVKNTRGRSISTGLLTVLTVALLSTSFDHLLLHCAEVCTKTPPPRQPNTHNNISSWLDQANNEALSHAMVCQRKKIQQPFQMGARASCL